MEILVMLLFFVATVAILANLAFVGTWRATSDLLEIPISLQDIARDVSTIRSAGL